jgi:uncharacterized membrane protein
MATMMTASVFLVIMPNQRKTIARMLKGETPDPKWGKQAKQRSTHNNYITLPVLFLMLSNHYPVLYANARWIPALVTLVIIAGALIRYFYNNYHADHSRRRRRFGARSGSRRRARRACSRCSAWRPPSSARPPTSRRRRPTWSRW